MGTKRFSTMLVCTRVGVTGMQHFYAVGVDDPAAFKSVGGILRRLFVFAQRIQQAGLVLGFQQYALQKQCAHDQHFMIHKKYYINC